MSAKVGKTKATASDMQRRLEVRIGNQKGDWLLMTEVRSATGYSDNIRSADAVAMSLWPSNGLELHGYEIKVTRSDLIKELTDHRKAEAVKQYCDRWWLVLPSEKLLKLNELPVDWGLMCSHGETLCIKKAAPKLDPEPMPRHFLASLLRAVDTAHGIQRKIMKARDEGYSAGKQYNERMLENDRAKVKELRELITTYESEIGERIAIARIPDLAKRLEVAFALNPKRILKRAECLRDDLQRSIDNFNRIDKVNDD